MDIQVIQAYILGALHDGTYSSKHKTFRITQSNLDWLKFLQRCFQKLEYKAWIYKEGKTRSVHALETTAKFLDLKYDPDNLVTTDSKIAYVRGYFDAEGGIPRDNAHWFYIQISQKNHDELVKVKNILESLNIQCGKIHIPSIKVDPDYFRFYISRKSHRDFVEIIGSWHPRKRKIMQIRMKI